MSEIYVLPPGLLDYSLLDSGDGRKLERFGSMILIRPEERAAWPPKGPAELWETARAEYRKSGGWEWKNRSPGPRAWEMRYGEIRFRCELSDSRQVGVFPENAMQWEWMSGVLRKLPAGRRILNLFGYTGIASLVAAACGAEVVHVDSSRRALRMGQANQSLSDLVNAKVRWLQDDALKFVEREARRGHTYHGLLLDPPLYGKGPRNETWQFEREIGRLCRLCRDLLEPEGAFVVMTAYGLNRSPAYLAQFLEVLLRGAAGKAAYGELRIPHETSRRRLSLAISARWVSEA